MGARDVRMRRAGWAALAAALAMAVLLSSAPVLAANKPKLGATDRRAISALLDRFVVEAIDRRDPAGAYDLATAALREGMTRAEWATGNIPVYPYGPRGTHFPWTLTAIVEGRVSVELLLQPRKKTDGALAYDVELRKQGGRWLVDEIQPVAAFAAPASTPTVGGPADFRPGGAAANASEGRLSLLWLGIAAGVLAVSILGLAAYVVIRNRRRRRRIEAELTRPAGLPPLPGRRAN